MSGYLFSPQAAGDVFEIWSYIARESVDAANRVEAAIFDACDLLAKFPGSGHLRQDLTERPLRFWTLSRYSKYMVVYRPETVPLQIVAVLHGRRNLPRILKSRP